MDIYKAQTKNPQICMVLGKKTTKTMSVKRCDSQRWTAANDRVPDDCEVSGAK